MDEIMQKLIKKYKRVGLLIPTYKLIPTKTHHCLTVFISKLYLAGFNPSVLMLDQTNVCVARNDLVKHFIESHENPKQGPYDVILWIDSDHIFDFEHFIKLLYDLDETEKDGVEVLSARYVTRDMEHPRLCAFLKDSKERKYTAVDYRDTGIKEVDTIGFGFVMMKPSALEKMKDKYGYHQFVFEETGPKEEGRIISEDMVWCERAKDIGIKIYLDHNVEVGHYGGNIDSKMFRIIREELVPEFESFIVQKYNVKPDNNN